jgi:hypothetical protein
MMKNAAGYYHEYHCRWLDDIYPQQSYRTSPICASAPLRQFQQNAQHDRGKAHIINPATWNPPAPARGE